MMLHSSRRSPRLQGSDNSNASNIPAQTQKVSNQVTVESAAIATTTPSATTSKSAVVSSKPFTPTTTNAVNVLEMQKQIALLKRQLSETQTKLSSSNRQCQQLESVIRYTESVSNHNLTKSVPPQITDTAASTPLPPVTSTAYSAASVHTTSYQRLNMQH